MAASRRSARIAAAAFERKVQIWDIETRELAKEFETNFSFGGYRLTLDASGERCITAGWEVGRRGGVACYEAETGRLIWHRQDLRHTQRVRFSHNSRTAWCVPESGPTELLDSVDGKTLDAIRDLADVFESEYSADLLLERRKRDYVLRKEKNFQVPRLTFAILDAAFGPQSVTISESGGPVRYIDSATGKELWRHTPAKHVHFLSLWYREIDRDFYGDAAGFPKRKFQVPGPTQWQQRRT